MSIQLVEMKIEYYESVIALWRKTEGIGLSSADSRQAIGGYLERNPGFSLVALDGEVIAGALLCGHDGRRGFIHHLAVDEHYRRQNLGRQMVYRVLAHLAQEGIQKCHLFVYQQNQEAISFWKQIGFTQRVDLSMMSKMTSEVDA